MRTVFIPKKQGGTRPLGIPTVGDRIAKGVVKDYLEPMLESVFHSSSFGYRPGRSAHDAIKQCQDNCIKYAWVIDVDIKGFFDKATFDTLLDAVSGLVVLLSAQFMDESYSPNSKSMGNWWELLL